MFSRSGYRAIPLGDFDRFQQSSTWLNGSQRGSSSLGYSYDPLGQLQRGLGAPQGLLSRICHGVVIGLVYLLTILTFPISGWFVLKTVPTYERVIVFRLGRIRPPKGPGLVLLLPFIDHGQRVDLRTRAFNIPPCKLTSCDGALVSVGADVQFRVCDPVLSVMTVKDLNMATRMTAQNAMTKILLKKYLREIQTEKLKIGEQLLLEVNDITKSWGLEVDRVELILEAVLQASPEKVVTAPGAPGVMNPVSGVQALDNTFQQLALHFFGNSLAAAGTSMKAAGLTSPETAARTSPKAPLTPEVTNVLSEEVSSLGISSAGSCSFRGDRILLVGSNQDELRAQVEHVKVQSAKGRPPTPAKSVKKRFDPDELLLVVNKHLSEALVNQVRACYQFNLRQPGGDRKTYFIDLSTGQGETGYGEPPKTPDVVLEMEESDLARLISGELTPLNAHFSGKLQVEGELSTALKLEQLFKKVKESIRE